MMRSFPPRPTALAQQLLEPCIALGDLVVDATAGNGNDTLFLARCVGVDGKVIALDCQPEAIASTQRAIEAAGLDSQVSLHCLSHEFLLDVCPLNQAAVVMFNLGYLPGADHEQTTLKETTLLALDAAVRALRNGGVLSVVCYPGHATGMDEAIAVEAWFVRMASLDWRVTRYAAIGTLKPAPILFLAEKPRSH
ncbi:MAG: methyltransferase domain-containing protein [Verrucomicrobia bacterium]|nr:MAG: methyltransferase domain-containing protein [Verrucomicrobiota bacterium]